ncbi:MAG: hypothetical protein IJ387_11980 [Thermoguttaceae bacterium]|nr:hypothetical protein [Thermoguttaceae bacterium]
MIWKVVEPTEAERAAEAEARRREKSREKNESQKNNDNNLKKHVGAGNEGRGRTVSADEIFAGESFEDEWAATEKEGRSEKSDAKENAARKPNVRPGDKKRGEEGTERVEKKEKNAKSDKKKALEALKQIFGGEKGVVGADGTHRTPLATSCEEVCEALIDAAFDAPPGLRPLADWNAFLGERGAEALKRLGRTTRRDDEWNAKDRDRRRLRLAPFATLSAEFPEWDRELRLFDALFDDACGGKDAATKRLLDFWRSWRRELDEETIGRICGAYEERLLGRATAEGGGAVERSERLLTALAIYSALFLER